MITHSIIPDRRCFIVLFNVNILFYHSTLQTMFVTSFSNMPFIWKLWYSNKGKKMEFSLSQAKIHIIRKQKMTNDRGFDALLYLRAWAGQEKQLLFLFLCFDNRHRMLSEAGIIFILPKIKINRLSELFKGSLVHCVCKVKRSKNKSLALSLSLSYTFSF